MLRFAIIEKKHANWMFALSKGFPSKSPDNQIYHLPREAQGADPFVYVLPLAVTPEDEQALRALPTVYLFADEEKAIAFANGLLDGTADANADGLLTIEEKKSWFQRLIS